MQDDPTTLSPLPAPAPDVTADETALANLVRHAEQARGAYAPNTERALRADVASFTGWCATARLTSLPASPDTLARYVDALAGHRAPATIRRAVSSVATFHRAAGLPSPAAIQAVVLALKRLHRAQGRVQVQASPLTRPLVDRMLDAAGTGPRAARNRALLAVAYDTLARRSELVAMALADLTIEPEGHGTVIISRGKTDQEGRGMVRYLAADTIRILQAWLDVSLVRDGVVFRAVGKAGAIGGPLDPGDVARAFKQMAKAAGIDPGIVAGISGHSSRVGAAQDMVRLGVELPAVMQAGGWKTAEMVSRYTAKLDARRSGAAKLAMMQNRG